MRRTGLVLLLALVLAGRLYAQGDPLDRAEAHALAGRYDEARALLERWWETAAAEPQQVEARVRARALWLRARLARDAAAAEQDFLALVLGYPTAPEAPEALLRLGQGLLAAGDTERALSYLERLATDYPATPHRAVGLLWLARAQRAAGRVPLACATASDGAAGGGEPALLSLLKAEQAATCGVSVPAKAAGPSTGAARPAGESLTGTGDFGVQVGAFREPAGARQTASELRRAGFDARLVHVPANDLLRVRVGRFRAPGDAAALAHRLRDAGFGAIVVDDVAQERPGS